MIIYAMEILVVHIIKVKLIFILIQYLYNQNLEYTYYQMYNNSPQYDYKNIFPIYVKI